MAKKSMYTFRNGLDEAENEAVGKSCELNTGDECRTVQAEKDNCDINEIVRRFKMGEGPLVNPAAVEASFLDLGDAPDLRRVLEIGKNASDTFNELPAELRKRFGNDPVELYKFIQNKDNVEEAVKLGLVRKHVIPAPVIPKISLDDESISKIRAKDS